MASCLQRQEFYLAQSLDAQGWRLGSPIDWASPENLKVHHIMEMCALGKAWDHTAIQLRLGFHNPSQNYILDWCKNFPLDSTFLIFHIQQWPPGAKLPTQKSLKNKSLPNPRMPSAQPATAYWSKEGMGGGWEGIDICYSTTSILSKETRDLYNLCNHEDSSFHNSAANT